MKENLNQQDVFASSQIIVFNPILNESEDTKKEYFLYLRKLIHLAKWDRRKYTKAQIAFYKDKLCSELESNATIQLPTFELKYSYLIPFDLAIMLAYHSKIVGTEKSEMILNRIATDFNLKNDAIELLRLGFQASLGDDESWNKILHHRLLKNFKEYISILYKNSMFLQQRPCNMLITATMSAGKSTLINALVGKNISLVQNMACTSKIHTIVSKPFEDGITSEYDHDMSIDATKEDLLTDNDDNKSAKITVGTYFNSLIGGKRIMVFDSPGVNSSENIEHTEITQKMIRSPKYKLLVYVLNATQLGTTDDEQHLEVVAKHLGRTKIIFVMNKIDHLISEDDNIIDAIERQRKFLVTKGFKNPIVCPVSSRSAFLAKKSQTEGLSQIEQRELENYMDKFEVQSLQDYYVNHIKCDSLPKTTDEVQMLLNNCGFNYFEKIIDKNTNGGKQNGTSKC